jgi:hypothetical protein
MLTAIIGLALTALALSGSAVVAVVKVAMTFAKMETKLEHLEEQVKRLLDEKGGA